MSFSEITIGALAGYGQTEQAAVLLQNALGKIGVKSKIVAETWPVASGKMRNEQQMYDLLPLWKSTYYADPNNWIGEMYLSDNWGTFKSSSFYKSKKVDALLNEALSLTDQAQRAKLYSEAERLIIDDAASVWIYNTRWFGPFGSRVESIRFSPIGNGQDARWIKLKAK